VVGAVPDEAKLNLLVEHNSDRKPVEFARFVEVVREIGLYGVSLNEPPPDTHSRTQARLRA
jgi:hypothetical protein